ncbi:MAG: anthranilate phosphoribosyltransferase [Endozoicomonas sp. (ex Botrylloides leachii)]|nr:anthranilate phosphoribosyltransferase [Endozoicomonas sp. (ex Botrylloides leachii)]
MHIKEAIAHVVQQRDLSREEMISIMEQIMGGKCHDAQIGSFLTAMRIKNESIDEIVGAATVMRLLMTPVKIQAKHLVDIVGTGGDEAHLFNVSTASAFVAAAAGAHVAKHGNRGVSSASGSADLLENSGMNMAISPSQVALCVEKIGVGFMFAPAYHSAMKHVAHIRKALGIRTLFNILGPLCNPASVENLVVGVFSKELCRPIAEVFLAFGSKHVMVVHSLDGLDEISISSETHVAELKQGMIVEYLIKPEDMGIHSQSLLGLSVADTDESLSLICDALNKRETTYAKKAADMIALNSGATIYVAGLTGSFQEGVSIACQIIQQGLALKKMQELASFSHSFY